MKALAYSKTGTKKETEANLTKGIFDLTANHELVGLAYRAYLANSRGANATTLTRGDVRGGGKKPWRQKGTGRARVGSIRVPHWKGGGVVFGPDGTENYSISVPTKTKREAIRQALSLQAADKKIVVIEDFVAADGKAKTVVNLLAKLNLEGTILLVVETKTPEQIRATNNLASVELVSAKYLNVFTIMNADTIVLTEGALKAVDGWLGAKS